MSIRILNKIRLKLKLLLKKHMLVGQYCKKCGKHDNFDFQVSDEVWSNLPEKYQDKELCLNCFIEEISENEFELILYKL